LYFFAIKDIFSKPIIIFFNLNNKILILNKTYFLPLFLVLSGVSYGQKNNKIAIAFYSCENFFGTHHKQGSNPDFTPEGKFHYTENIYHQKLHNIASVLQSMGEDASSSLALIALAQVENEQVLSDLSSQPGLQQHHYQFICLDAPAKNGLNLALLYDPAIFTILYSETIPVNYNKEPLPYILYIKGLLYGDTLHILINHWSSGRNGESNSSQKHMASAKACKNKIDSLLKSTPTANIILMGDLSTNPTDSILADELGARTERNSSTPSVLYNPWAEIYKSGRGSQEYLDHWDLFDQILLSGSFLKPQAPLHFQKALVFKKDFMADHNKRFLGYPHASWAGTEWINGYSDHFPIIIYLSYH
jgi:hypothetical protein